jgi:2-hydroxy-6-oxonona-2,4-dienedioate hydrolase
VAAAGRTSGFVFPILIGIAALNHIDNSRLVLLNKCGHWPPYEHPEEYTAQVLNFLR